MDYGPVTGVDVGVGKVFKRDVRVRAMAREQPQ
jgi:hypothetical protein